MAKTGRISLRLLEKDLKDLILGKVDKLEFEQLLDGELSEIQVELSNKANKEEVYTKGEIDAIGSLPHTEFLDGGSFLDTYSSLTGSVDGGEF
jgi:ABC-type oligopeptide transport system substrate-binding subunit